MVQYSDVDLQRLRLHFVFVPEHLYLTVHLEFRFLTSPLLVSLSSYCFSLDRPKSIYAHHQLLYRAMSNQLCQFYNITVLNILTYILDKLAYYN